MKLQRQDFVAKPTPQDYDVMVEQIIAFYAEKKVDPLDSIVISAMLNASFEIRVTVLWPLPDSEKP